MRLQSTKQAFDCVVYEVRSYVGNYVGGGGGGKVTTENFHCELIRLASLVV